MGRNLAVLLVAVNLVLGTFTADVSKKCHVRLQDIKSESQPDKNATNPVQVIADGAYPNDTLVATLVTVENSSIVDSVAVYAEFQDYFVVKSLGDGKFELRSLENLINFYEDKKSTNLNLMLAVNCGGYFNNTVLNVYIKYPEIPFEFTFLDKSTIEINVPIVVGSTLVTNQAMSIRNGNVNSTGVKFELTGLDDNGKTFADTMNIIARQQSTNEKNLFFMDIKAKGEYSLGDNETATVKITAQDEADETRKKHITVIFIKNVAESEVTFDMTSFTANLRNQSFAEISEKGAELVKINIIQGWKNVITFNFEPETMADLVDYSNPGKDIFVRFKNELRDRLPKEDFTFKLRLRSNQNKSVAVDVLMPRSDNAPVKPTDSTNVSANATDSTLPIVTNDDKDEGMSGLSIALIVIAVVIVVLGGGYYANKRWLKIF